MMLYVRYTILYIYIYISYENTCMFNYFQLWYDLLIPLIEPFSSKGPRLPPPFCPSRPVPLRPGRCSCHHSGARNPPAEPYLGGLWKAGAQRSWSYGEVLLSMKIRLWDFCVEGQKSNFILTHRCIGVTCSFSGWITTNVFAAAQ